MHVLLKYISDVVEKVARRQEKTLLEELRLTEAIIRSDLNEISGKIDKINQDD